MNIVFSEHAIFEINRRKIKKEDIENLIKYPPQKLMVRTIESLFRENI
jgi:hypothetical protein